MHFEDKLSIKWEHYYPIDNKKDKICTFSQRK